MQREKEEEEKRKQEEERLAKEAEEKEKNKISSKPMLGSKPFGSKPNFGKPRMLSKANPSGGTASSSYIPSAIDNKPADKPPVASYGGGYTPSALS